MMLIIIFAVIVYLFVLDGYFQDVKEKLERIESILEKLSKSNK